MYSRILLFTALSMVHAGAALAGSGHARVKMRYYDNNGGFCGGNGTDDYNCSWTENGVNRPLKHAKVYVIREDDGGIIGQGALNASGEATVSWWTFFLWDVPDAQVCTRYEHKDNRFLVRTSTGNFFQNCTSTKALKDGGTVDFGTRTLGADGDPHTRANTYGSAQLMWDSLDSSNRMVNVFYDVEIRAYNTDGDNDTDGPGRRIRLSTSRQFMAGTVLHEMGHMASYLAHPFRVLVDYCFPGTRNNDESCSGDQSNSHSARTAEWQSAAFEEGFATFIGNRAIYGNDNGQPLDCRIASLPCSALDESDNARRDLESDAEDTGVACDDEDNPRGSWELTVTRYLRDVYDQTTARDSYTDSLDRQLGPIIDVWVEYQNGNDNHQHEEPFDFWGNVDNRNGRSYHDFYWNARHQYSSPFNSWTQYQNNCGN